MTMLRNWLFTGRCSVAVLSFLGALLAQQPVIAGDKLYCQDHGWWDEEDSDCNQKCPKCEAQKKTELTEEDKKTTGESASEPAAASTMVGAVQAEQTGLSEDRVDVPLLELTNLQQLLEKMARVKAEMQRVGTSVTEQKLELQSRRLAGAAENVVSDPQDSAGSEGKEKEEAATEKSSALVPGPNSQAEGQPGNELAGAVSSGRSEPVAATTFYDRLKALLDERKFSSEGSGARSILKFPGVNTLKSTMEYSSLALLMGDFGMNLESGSASFDDLLALGLHIIIRFLHSDGTVTLLFIQPQSEGMFELFTEQGVSASSIPVSDLITIIHTLITQDYPFSAVSLANYLPDSLIQQHEPVSQQNSEVSYSFPPPYQQHDEEYQSHSAITFPSAQPEQSTGEGVIQLDTSQPPESGRAPVNTPDPAGACALDDCTPALMPVSNTLISSLQSEIPFLIAGVQVEESNQADVIFTEQAQVLQSEVEVSELSGQMQGHGFSSAGDSPQFIENVISTGSPVLMQLTLNQEALVVHLQPVLERRVRVLFGSDQAIVDVRDVPVLVDWLTSLRNLVLRAFYYLGGE